MTPLRIITAVLILNLVTAALFIVIGLLTNSQLAYLIALVFAVSAFGSTHARSLVLKSEEDS